jgi:glycerol-3-phosphate dehydrogenase
MERASLDGERFDVAIIGGGINGVAIARECARGGKRTLLVERSDFGSGTTSRSTRIIHGGLRYLEHGEIGLVRESLRERERLLRERPHLVRPLQFVLALPPGRRSALEVRLGLWLYRRFAASRNGFTGGGARATSTRATLDGILDRNGGAQAWSVFSYDDAQCEFPERLVAEWLAEALAAGLVARNHTGALEAEISEGRIRGLRLRDGLDGREYRVEAAAVINAAGPWADEICRRSGVDTGRRMIGGVRGSHLVLPRFAGAPECALYTEAVDGRPIFLAPWNGQVLFGTTEVADTGDPERARPSADELAYLWRSFQRLFPLADLSLGDIQRAFAGVRPLPYAPGRKAADITRRHLLRDHAEDGAAGMISVIGGKLTTAASLARECARRLGVPAPEPQFASLADAALAEELVERFVREVGEWVPPQTARALAEWHGPCAAEIARRACIPQLGRTICEHTPHIVAEAVHAADHECAVTLADILLRRVPVALGACWSEECARNAAQRIGWALGWDEHRIAAEHEALEQECAAFLVKPASSLPAAA